MALKNYLDLTGLGYFRDKILANTIIEDTYTLVPAGTKNVHLQYYTFSGTTYTPVAIADVPDTIPADTYYTINKGSKSDIQHAPSIRGMTDFTKTYVDLVVEREIAPAIDAKVSSISYGTKTISGSSFTGLYYTNGGDHTIVAVDSTDGGTYQSTNLVTSGAVYSGLSGKADKATTLSGYGITDANINNGVITLGSNTITPVTSHQTVTNVGPTLSWGTTSTVGTVGSTDLTVTMPANPDTNYYPTAFAWTDGTTSGPTGSLTGTGMSAVSFGAIPSASASASGVVTTDTQTFAGSKTFESNISVTGSTTTNTLSVSSTAYDDSTAASNALYCAGGIYGAKVYNAVWMDLVDCVNVPEDTELEYGKCYCFDGEKYYQSSKYLDDGIIGIHSDTAGMVIGNKPGKNLKCAVAGYVLAYVDREYKPGTPLTCTCCGMLTEISKQDKMEYPEKIVATYWKPEPNNEWGDNEHKVIVNGRHWVKIK